MNSYSFVVVWTGLSRREWIKDFLEENCQDNRDSELVKVFGMYYISSDDLYKVSTEKYQFETMDDAKTKMLNTFQIDIIAVPV
jgi:hypothetical protein